MPLPLAILGLALLWRAAPQWRASSWWSGCTGVLGGQLPALATCTLVVLPAILSAWLLWLPRACNPLSFVVALLCALLSAAALLFWSGALPLLPRADVEDQCARSAVRRSTLYLLHPLYYAFAVAYGEPGSSDTCTKLWEQAGADRETLLATLSAELAAQTPQGMVRDKDLVLQACVAVLCLYAVVSAELPVLATVPLAKLKAS